MKKISTLLLIYIFLCFAPAYVFSIENKILLKVNNEIITSIDVLNEANYLMAMNKNINKMSKDDVYKISINTLLRQRIKKIEVLKNISEDEINLDTEYLEKLIISTYENLGFKKREDFINHLKKFDLDILFVKEKISIESLWNELVFKKFSSRVLIDKQKLRKKVINDNNKKIKSYLLSEIVFKITANEKINQKFDIIKKDIIQKGFPSAVLLHSISDTSKNQGNLGWITDASLNKKIKDKIRLLNVGKFTDPIIIPGGFLILKLENIKEVQNTYDIENKLDELIRYTTNQQLNQLSNIYYDKVKKEVTINEL